MPLKMVKELPSWPRSSLRIPPGSSTGSPALAHLVKCHREPHGDKSLCKTVLSVDVKVSAVGGLQGEKSRVCLVLDGTVTPIQLQQTCPGHH